MTHGKYVWFLLLLKAKILSMLTARSLNPQMNLAKADICLDIYRSEVCHVSHT